MELSHIHYEYPYRRYDHRNQGFMTVLESFSVQTIFVIALNVLTEVEAGLIIELFLRQAAALNFWFVPWRPYCLCAGRLLFRIALKLRHYRQNRLLLGASQKQAFNMYPLDHCFHNLG